eukprot:78148_1
MADDYKSLLKSWGDAIDTKFGKDAATQCIEVLEDLFEEKEEVATDLEAETWDDSAIMDTLHENHSAFKDPKVCKTFFKVFKAIVNGKYDSMFGDVVLLPEDMEWDCDEKDIKEAQEFMNAQCPGGGFVTSAENKNLFKTIAIGRKNHIELLNIIITIYELAHVQEIIDAKRDFNCTDSWTAQCRFFAKNKKEGNILRRSIPEFKKRISGGGPRGFIVNRIEDDINVYIEYVLLMNTVIRNIMSSDENGVCPLQVDLVIVGRKHSEASAEDEKEDAKEEEEEDDDDIDPLDQLAMTTQDTGTTALNNAIPGGFCGVLKTQDIEFAESAVSLDDGAASIRTIQDMIMAKIGKERRQRIIVCIDREDKDAKEDKLIVYQLENDAINKDYNEMHLSWKTKNQLIPNYKNEHEEVKELTGATLDIGDKGFVISFHVHSKDRVKCDVWIKTQQLPFLPYHLVEIWPMYWHDKFKKIDDKYTLEYIYKHCTAQSKDPRLMKWLETIDPVLYGNLKKKHLKYQS